MFFIVAQLLYGWMSGYAMVWLVCVKYDWKGRVLFDYMEIDAPEMASTLRVKPLAIACWLIELSEYCREEQQKLTWISDNMSEVIKQYILADRMNMGWPYNSW